MLAPDAAAHVEQDLALAPPIAENVIRILALQDDPELTGRPRSRTSAFLSLSPSVAPVPPAIAAALLRHIEIRISSGQILTVSARFGDADKAATVANAWAEEYVRRSLHRMGPGSKAQPDKLRRQLAQLETLSGERARLALRYGSLHPKMIAAEQDLAALREELTENQQQIIPMATARIAAPAVAPLAPVERSRWWFVTIAALGGLMAGIWLAFINEKFKSGFKTRRELEDITGRKVLGVIPMPSGLLIPAHGSHVLQKPTGSSAEAVRSLRAALRLLSEKEARPLKVVAITSSVAVPAETQGRALLSLWLGRLAARAGERVLIVDADLRQPQLRTLTDQGAFPSLVDYLTGQAYLEQIVCKQDASGAHIIFGAAVPNTALDLIGSDKMKKLSAWLRQSYDLVIYCAPPCLPSADAAVIANEADYTLYVVAGSHTKRTNLVEGLRIFAGFGYGSLSLVMTKQTKA